MVDSHQQRAKIWSLRRKLSHYELADIINRFTSKINYNMRVSYKGDQQLIGRILTKDGKRFLTPHDLLNMMEDLHRVSREVMTYRNLMKLLDDHYRGFKRVYEIYKDGPEKFEILARFLFIALLILATDFSRQPRFGITLIVKEVKDLKEVIKSYKRQMY